MVLHQITCLNFVFWHPVSTTDHIWDPHTKLILLCCESDLWDMVSGHLPMLHHASGTPYQLTWKTNQNCWSSYTVTVQQTLGRTYWVLPSIAQTHLTITAPSPNVPWSGLPPKSNSLFCGMHHISTEFCENLLRGFCVAVIPQTNKCRRKHNLLGVGNVNSRQRHTCKHTHTHPHTHM